MSSAGIVAAEASTTMPDWEHERRFPISVSMYHGMIEKGVLGPDDKVELIEGDLIKRYSSTMLATYVHGTLGDMLRKFEPDGWHLAMVCAITMDDSEPEPDIMFCRGVIRDYITHHPYPHQVGLVIEIATAESIVVDAVLKRSIYARAGIPLYWVVGTEERFIQVFTEPDSKGDCPDYRCTKRFTATDDVPVVLDGKAIGTISGKLLWGPCDEQR